MVCSLAITCEDRSTIGATLVIRCKIVLHCKTCQAPIPCKETDGTAGRRARDDPDAAEPGARAARGDRPCRFERDRVAHDAPACTAARRRGDDPLLLRGEQGG